MQVLIVHRLVVTPLLLFVNLTANYFRMVLRKGDGSILLFGFLQKYCACLRHVLANDDRYMRFDNSSLFCGNPRQCVAQKLSMIKANICDDRENGGDNIRTV